MRLNQNNLVGYWPLDGNALDYAATNALVNGLAHFWKLDETTGNAADSVAGNTGTATNVTWQAGILNNGASFNGTSSKIFTGNVTAGNDWSCSFWYKPATTNTGKIPISMDTVSGSQRIWDFTHNSSNQVYVDAWASDGTFYGQTATASGFSAGTWYHMVITWSASANALTLYKNTASLVSIAVGSKNARTTATPMGIGARANGTGDQWSDGMIDEVGFWTRALSTLEIKQLYNNGLAVTYPLASVGTVQNGTVTEALPVPAQSSIQSSLAYKFDGSNDKIDMGTTTGNVKTVMFWAKPTSANQSYLQLNASAYLRDNGELFMSKYYNDPNLVAYYKLEDVNDSKNSYNLTNNNTSTFAAAKFNNGLDLGTANTNKSLSSTTDFGMTATQNKAVGGWVKMRTDVSGSKTEQYFVVMAFVNAAGTAMHISYEYNSGTPRLRFLRYAGTNSLQYYTVTLGTSNWHHVAIVYDGTNVKGYYNGNEVTTAVQSGTQSVGGTNFMIGTNAVSGGSFSSAYFDDWFVFDRALSGAEISEIYNLTSLNHVGFTSPTTYVNGRKNGVVKPGRWNHYAITSGTAVSATAIKLGVQNSTFFNGQMQEVVMYDTALSAQDISNYYNFVVKPQKVLKTLIGSLGAAYTLTMAYGTFILTGQTSLFTKALIALMEFGSYTYTGVAAVLMKGKRLVMNVGSYVLTGKDSILHKVIPMVMGSGDYALTGLSLLFQAARKIFATVGSYILTGRNAVIRFSGWKNTSKNSSSWSNGSKNTSIWTNKDKN